LATREAPLVRHPLRPHTDSPHPGGPARRLGTGRNRGVRQAMQDHTTGEPPRDGQPAQGGGPPWDRADWLLLGLLVALAAGIPLWQLAHTEVAARDSIGFIRIAWQLHQRPLAEWGGVIAGSEQHPVYPLAVLAASAPLRHVVRLTSGGDPRSGYPDPRLAEA